MAQGEPRDEQELPEVFVQLKYGASSACPDSWFPGRFRMAPLGHLPPDLCGAEQLTRVCPPAVLFSWPNTPLLKRDGLARNWFKSHATMSTFVDTLGGFPLTAYEATLPGLAPELFLAQHHVDALIADLSHLMGPSRARASVKETAFRKRSELVKGSPAGQIRTHVFHSQEELERRFGELKDGDDWIATTAHWRELKRAQSAWTFCRDRVVRGEIGEPHYVAVDVETWEHDHDLITEVGIACLRFDPNGGSQFTTRHYGNSFRLARTL